MNPALTPAFLWLLVPGANRPAWALAPGPRPSYVFTLPLWSSRNIPVKIGNHTVNSDFLHLLRARLLSFSKVVRSQLSGVAQDGSEPHWVLTRGPCVLSEP